MTAANIMPAEKAGLPSTRLGLPGIEPLSRAPVLGLPIAIGLAVLIIFFGLFGTWAATAPLDSAAIAPGIVGVESSRKTIQHLEGGIVKSILVHDGDVVAAGQVLITLDDTRARATLELLRDRSDTSLALAARLTAERDGAVGITFPPVLTRRYADPDIATIMSSQENIFALRRRSNLGQVAILGQRIAQMAEETKGLNGEIAAEERQLDLIAEEVAVVETLVADGLARRPRLLALQRQAAEIEGRRSQNQAEIARISQAVSEAQLRISEVETRFLNEVVQELREVQTTLFDLSERLHAAADVLDRTKVRAPIAGTVLAQRVLTRGGVIQPGETLLDRTKVRAPIAGTVLAQRVLTRGGVIQPGETLLDMVPSEEKLIIEARVDPVDIDIVRPGLPALIRLTALSVRNTSPIEGEVVSISADRLTDERTNQDYFLARVELRGDPALALQGGSLSSGMQAEVMIVTGTRTPLQYLLQPAKQSLNRAFREP